MDVRYFLKQRVDFIRQLYVTSSAAYIERKRLIEAGVEPFIAPYSEDPEPPFLDEWLEAEESLQVLGRTCISMLAAVFHLYFKTWEHQVGIPVDDSLKKTDFKNGWLNGYKAYFANHFQIRLRTVQLASKFWRKLSLQEIEFNIPNQLQRIARTTRKVTSKNYRTHSSSMEMMIHFSGILRQVNAHGSWHRQSESHRINYSLL